MSPENLLEICFVGFEDTLLYVVLANCSTTYGILHCKQIVEVDRLDFS